MMHVPWEPQLIVEQAVVGAMVGTGVVGLAAVGAAVVGAAGVGPEAHADRKARASAAPVVVS